MIRNRRYDRSVSVLSLRKSRRNPLPLFFNCKTKRKIHSDSWSDPSPDWTRICSCKRMKWKISLLTYSFSLPYWTPSPLWPDLAELLALAFFVLVFPLLCLRYWPSCLLELTITTKAWRMECKRMGLASFFDSAWTVKEKYYTLLNPFPSNPHCKLLVFFTWTYLFWNSKKIRLNRTKSSLLTLYSR